MTNTRTINISAKTFDRLREDANYQGGLEAGTNYNVHDEENDTVFYAHTPDGIGCVYYDNPTQRREDVG